MYSYTYDDETGGILLNGTPTNFSKEPRPVYAMEMDILGFDKYWNYEKQNDFPYMWAEANLYWYHGVQIAKTKGGDLYTKPELIPTRDESGDVLFPKESGHKLRKIDIETMCKKNADLMTVIEDASVKRIVKEYEKFKNRLDIFHVAFSGGKDSAVLLDLVKKALPQGSFVVIFGDTGMEFPDTYETVKITKQKCEEDGTPFYISKSHFDPKDSWKLFGPPARVLRWCCSVHKSTPQTLKMREITGKDNYIGMDYVGVRACESVTRSKYDYENFGKKQKGQYSFNAILDWTSAEIWIYIFSEKLHINDAYKKGNSRAGCLFCPMSGGSSDYFRRCAYEKEIDQYVDFIKESYTSKDIKQVNSYLMNGGWNARNNGRSLRDNPNRCIENNAKHQITISVINPQIDWKEWIKTLGQLSVEEDSYYSIQFEGNSYSFQVVDNEKGYIVYLPEKISVENPKFVKLFRQVFRKAAYCGACQVCETNCRNGSIKFENGKLSITNCIHCYQCHMIDSGCLLFHSLRLPQGGGKNMKSLNSFADHAPKRDWLVSFFELKENFFTEHSLGPMMYDMFRRFLKDAGLNDKNHFTDFAELVSNIGWETETALGLILVNLAMENPQIAWYVNNMDIGYYYEKSKIEDMLTMLEVKPKDAKSIVKAFVRIVETPFGSVLNFGYADDEDLVRTKCNISDNRVLLYALYKFVEKCNMDKEFHVSYLYDENVERDGVSPVRLFGLYDEEELKSMLLGLSAAYPEYINATFTNDLKTISLREKTSQDVLKLFEEDL